MAYFQTPRRKRKRAERKLKRRKKTKQSAKRPKRRKAQGDIEVFKKQLADYIGHTRP